MIMEKITARTNDKIKHAVRLGESASLRKEAGEFFLEGARLCFDAVQTGIEIKQAFFTAKALWKYSEYTESIIAASGICYEISAEVSQKLSDTENPQGVFCICEIKNEGTRELNPKGKYIALENLQVARQTSEKAGKRPSGACCRGDVLVMPVILVGKRSGSDVYHGYPGLFVHFIHVVVIFHRLDNAFGGRAVKLGNGAVIAEKAEGLGIYKYSILSS